MIKQGSVTVLFIIFFFLFAQAQETGIEIGDIAPEISLENPDGEVVKLSSLRGKVVLIDFWASWCGPCKREIPTKNKVYSKYANSSFTIGKGFTIYGVSLDRNPEAWINAIKEYEHEWYHVSDLKHWNSAPAREYGVRGIPYNFLIDKNGVIIAKNLRGDNLFKTLNKYIYVDPLIELEVLLKDLKNAYEKLKTSEDYKDNTRNLRAINRNIRRIKDAIESMQK